MKCCDYCGLPFKKKQTIGMLPSGLDVHCDDDIDCYYKGLVTDKSWKGIKFRIRHKFLYHKFRLQFMWAWIKYFRRNKNGK